jgi:succinate dehydrogenase/fumarate reductase flavoprotein subunit
MLTYSTYTHAMLHTDSKAEHLNSDCPSLDGDEFWLNIAMDYFGPQWSSRWTDASVFKSSVPELIFNSWSVP